MPIVAGHLNVTPCLTLVHFAVKRKHFFAVGYVGAFNDVSITVSVTVSVTISVTKAAKVELISRGHVEAPGCRLGRDGAAAARGNHAGLV